MQPDSQSDTPTAEPPAQPQPVPIVMAPPQRSRWPAFVAWLLALAAMAMVLLLWQKVLAMQVQLARQSAEASSLSIEAHTLAEQANAETLQSAGKLAALDARVRDATAYRAQMRELVQSVAVTRDENLLADLEVSLHLAEDQAQLTGNPQPLLVALRSAERRLTRSKDPRLIPVMQAVDRDLERVKEAPVSDTAGLLVRIDQLQAQVDELPLKPAPEAPRATGEPTISTAAATGGPAPGGWWEQLRCLLSGSDCAATMAAVAPSLPMPRLDVDRDLLLRESLKMRLQSARLGILARQYESARLDLAGAATHLRVWFDDRAPAVQSAADHLRQIRELTLTPQLPGLEDTLAALGAAASAEP